MADWSKNEKLWIARAKRLFREKPESIRLYSTDGELSACKAGVSLYDLLESVADGRSINSGSVLTDMHTID